MSINNNEFIDFDSLLSDELRDSEFKEVFEKESLKISVINEITNIRKKNNLTQQEMAKIVGVPQGNISRFERGKVEPTLEFIEKVATKMGYTLKIDLIETL